MDKIKTVNICPKCYSYDYYIFNDAGLIAGQIGIYTCNNCGFSGTIFPQIDLDKLPKLKKIRKFKPIIKKVKPENKKQNKVNWVNIFIVLLLIFLTYTGYRFGLFDFAGASHKHAVDFFSKYVHLG